MPASLASLISPASLASLISPAPIASLISPALLSPAPLSPASLASRLSFYSFLGPYINSCVEIVHGPRIGRMSNELRGRDPTSPS